MPRPAPGNRPSNINRGSLFSSSWQCRSPGEVPQTGHSIIGHGRRRKQAHDQDHDWIGIQRGICKLCGKTFTFLPWFSPPYCHYSLIARGQALYRYFVENYSLEMSAPLVRDPDRLPSGATLRRWFRKLDTPELWQRVEQLEPDGKCPSPPPSPPGIRDQTPFRFLPKIVQAISQWLARGEISQHGPLLLGWRTLACFLHILLPLRI